ncbi:MAG: nucleotide exchange factor GrpE [Paludibacteraceae bacterium]|nr:nucleotide exchange factor GrpE [Paludibacteraceae bacterium]
MSEEKEELKQNADSQTENVEQNAETATEAPAAEAELTPEEQAAAKIAELEAKVEQQHNDYLLLYADFENYKKRTFKEKTDAIWAAKKGILEDMLSVIDDFERGLKELEKVNDESVSSFKEGIDNIYRKFSNFIAQKGVTLIETKDQDFNTDFHEAVAIIPAPGMNNKIIDCTQKGYMLGDKVMRHAKVVVGQDANADTNESK